MNKRVPLLYIAGSSHSGSTLLDLLLGSHPGIESVGEAKKVAVVSARIRAGEEPVCTCRKPVAMCAFWRAAMPQDAEALRSDASANAEFFRRVLQARGKLIALDSSKSPGRARMLAHSNLFDLTVVHIVRDSRAVAYSNRRKQARAVARNPAYNLMPTVHGWNKLNMRVHCHFSNEDARLLVIRYEDLTREPAAVLRGALSAVGLPWDESVLRYREQIHHNIEGNRMRMGSDSAIHTDDEYLRAMPQRDWWLATLLSWRGLRAFGYPLKRSPVVAVGAGRLSPSLS